MVQLSVFPAVYDIQLQFSNSVPSLELCELTVAIGDDETVSLNANMTTSELQVLLDSTEAIQRVGGVWVDKRDVVIEGDRLVTFRIIMRTDGSITQQDIPSIDITEGSSDCSNNYTLSSELVQSLTTPTFQLRFPDSSRQTRPLIATTTATELQAEFEQLLTYNCSRNGPPNVSSYTQ